MRPPVPKYPSKPKDEEPVPEHLPPSTTMTPRVLESARTHVVMTPRSSQPHDGYQSKTRVISGPAKPAAAKEKSHLDPAKYQDRAVERRRMEREGASSAAEGGLDWAGLEEVRKSIRKAGVDKSKDMVRNDLSQHEASSKGGSLYEAVFKYAKIEGGLADNDATTSSIWEPGRAILMYDFERYGPQPQVQVRSEVEMKAANVHRKSEQQLSTDREIIESVRRAFNVIPLDSTQSEPVPAEIFDDIFADDDEATAWKDLHESRHKDRMKPTLASAQTEITASVLPAVQKLIDSTRHHAEDAGSEEDEEPKPSPIDDDYAECYPGVYEAAGIEFDSDGADDMPDKTVASMSKRRAATMEQRKQQKRATKEADQIEKIMQNKYG